MRADAVRHGDVQANGAAAAKREPLHLVASSLPEALDPSLAPSASGEVALAPALVPAAALPLEDARRRAFPLGSLRGLAPAVIGGLVVVAATVAAVLTTSADSAAIVPATVLALAAWCTALEYLDSGGVLSPMALGTPVVSAVAGAISLAGASAAAMLLPLPQMQVVDRDELLIMALGVALGVALYEVIKRRFGPRQRVLVVGAGDGGAELVDELQDRRDIPFECVGLLDSARDADAVLGDLDDLVDVVGRERPHLIVLAGVDDRAAAMKRIFEACRFRFRLVELNHFYEHVFGRLPLKNLTPAWFMGLLHLHRRPYSRISKRTFDLALTAIAIVPVALLFPLVALLVRCSGPGPILFKQVRLGEGGRLFKIVKFRTMVVDAERHGQAVWASVADPRITPIGRFMRRTRLDELPQLWNVLRGDMSIVGPRPERPEFLEQLAKEVPFWERRHLVKPGITGWAQVRCGYTDDSLGAADKLSHDLYYLKHRSLLVDVAIVAKTAAIVVRGTGAH